MAILDKITHGIITKTQLQSLAVFVDSFAGPVRARFQEAKAEGIRDPLIWLLDCQDEFGARLARDWLKGEPGHDCCNGLPDVLIRPVSYQKARDRIGTSSLSITVPAPSSDQIDVLAVTLGGIYVVAVPTVPKSQLWPVDQGHLLVVVEELAAQPQQLLLQAVVEPIEKTDEGQLIRAVAVPWLEILKQIERDPAFLFEFTKYPRKFEEFIAASYERAGWHDVILTPRSRDGGRDVIASKPGLGSIRFLEQCKAYSPGRLVTHDDVRAMLGVLQTNPNGSKGLITTTSQFQPEIAQSREFSPFIPYRLELRDGSQLRQWLAEIARTQK